MGMDANDPDAAFEVLDFWERATLAFRGDGTLQAWDTDDVRPYEGAIAKELLEGTVAVDDEERVDHQEAQRDARRVLVPHVVRHADRVHRTPAPTQCRGTKDRSCSSATSASSRRATSGGATSPPTFRYDNLTAALVLDGVKFRVTDFGTSYTTPEDYLDHLVRFGLFTTDSAGALHPVPLDEIDAIVAAVRKAQSAHYRNIAAMDRDEKIRCGAYVYFSFLRPFAQAAGIADELDWTVPRDIPPPLYEFVSMLEGDNTASSMDGAYYDLIP